VTADVPFFLDTFVPSQSSNHAYPSLPPRGVLGRVLRGLPEDREEIAMGFIESLRRRVLGNADTSRGVKLAAVNAFSLEQLTGLYQRKANSILSILFYQKERQTQKSKNKTRIS